jgi:hypothetical protein
MVPVMLSGPRPGLPSRHTVRQLEQCEGRRTARGATSICGGGSTSTSLRRDPPGQHVLDPAHHTHLGFNSGVSIEVVRRLGHASTETTQIYAELADQVADTEIGAARRMREASRR